MRKVAATKSALEQLGQINLNVFGEYTADIVRNCINHFLREKNSLLLDKDDHKTPLPLFLQILLEDVGTEDESYREEEVEIFVLNPNMEEFDAGG